ncbi:MAG: diaminopimelate epimerase [Bacilli bacterium]
MELYHGCQNSFIITEDRYFIEHPKDVPHFCQQYEVDGLIVYIKAPLEMVLFNADGSLATMCGNGIRCFVKYGIDAGLILEDKVVVKTLAGNRVVQVLKKSPFFARVNLGTPSFQAKKMDIDISEEEMFGQSVMLLGQIYPLYAVWTGTDHVVVLVKNFKSVEAIGPLLGRNKLFKRGINVNFMRIIDSKHIEVHTFERGVGWTKACGTGSSACVVVGNRLGLLESEVKVQLLGGELMIELVDQDVYMSGPAVKID